MKKRLSEMCLPTETIDPRAEPDSEFLYVDISAVDRRTKRITAVKKIRGKEAPSRARKLIRDGDVILATTRPNLNAVATVPIELDGQVCSTGFCVLRPGTTLNRDFLFFYLQHESFVAALVDLVRGALYPAVSDKQVLSQEIFVPDLPTQRRIAARLKEQMEHIEALRAGLAAQSDALSLLPGAYLREAFGEGDGEDPGFTKI